jgi:hypothetical protein
MNTNNVTAPAGKKIRALLLSALIVSIMAGTLFVPAMAVYDPNWCNSCSPPDENGMRICTMQYCGPVIIPEPLPPCCVYGPFGEPYCFGVGMCRMDPIPLGGQETRN